jgi:hypothetical protein
MHRLRKQDAERGQALIEFALTVPIFLMLVFGIIDLARLIFAYTQVIDAARQGVRYGIVEGLDQGNVQYLDCNGIDGAVRDTPGLVPGSDMGVTISYLNLQDNSVPLAQCGGSPSGYPPEPSYNLIKDGAVLAVKVEGDITPITPVLAMFDNSIHFGYTAKRAIAESAAYTDKWPSAPQVPKNFRSPNPDCVNGRVYFSWEPLNSWPDRIEIRDSFTNAVVQAIDYPETQYAYCEDDRPPGRRCGVDIDPNGGYGMWYMVVIQDGLESTSSFDTTASCKANPGGGGPGSGTVSFSGVVFYDKNHNGRQGGNEDGMPGIKIVLREAGPDGVLYSPPGNEDDVVKTAYTNVLGEFTFTGTIPAGRTTGQFVMTPPYLAAMELTTGNPEVNFTDMADGMTRQVDFGYDDR